MTIWMLDLRTMESGTFTLTDALAEQHKKDVSFIRSEVATFYDGPTVVVTHHLPLHRFLAPRFATDALSSAFASKLDLLIE